MADKKDQLCCQFCGRPAGKGLQVIQGGNSSICEECVGIISEMLNPKGKQQSEEASESSSLKDLKIPLPSEIKETLDAYCIGQDEA